MDRKGKKKFDFIIGNPPYQEDMEGTSDKPVYNYFMDAAYELAEKVELITPARFLFNAGKTPKEWNRKMLDDPHLKVMQYWPKSEEVFSNNTITGGLVITYRAANKILGPIIRFMPNEILASFLSKIKKNNFVPINKLIFSPESYKLTELIHQDYPDLSKELSFGHKYDLTTNIFTKLKNIFLDKDPGDKNYVGINGRDNGKRIVKWILRNYIFNHPNLDSYKIIIPKSNGAPTLEHNISTPIIGLPELLPPGVGHNQTFMSFGIFKVQDEAKSALKYIKTKFVRCLVGILKATQHNPPATWKYVPLQDFTANSDIDWSKSIPEIDRQLYAKYGLDEKEIDFIETHVKEME